MGGDKKDKEVVQRGASKFTFLYIQHEMSKKSNQRGSNIELMTMGTQNNLETKRSTKSKCKYHPKLD